MRFKLLLAALMVGLSSCERGYRVQGAYLAPKSGYRVDLILQGMWDSDAEMVTESYKLAQICPLKPNHGRPVQFSIDNPRERGIGFFQKETAKAPTQEWDFRSSSVILRETLAQSGFRVLDNVETTQMAEVLSSGWGARADLKAITVIKETSNSKYPFDQTKPHRQWIALSELPPCKQP
jgi:hypothetical protein